jgi:hypothetical protein
LQDYQGPAVLLEEGRQVQRVSNKEGARGRGGGGIVTASTP